MRRPPIRLSFVLAATLLGGRPAAAGDLLAYSLPGTPWNLAPGQPAAGGTAPAPALPTEGGPQAGPAGSRPARPTGRVALHTSTWQVGGPGQRDPVMTEVVTAVNYQLVDREDDGVEFGLNLRHSGFTSGERRPRLSIYDGFVGLRLRNGAMRIRGGHLWLNELGGLGAIAGGMIDVGQRQGSATRVGRVRAGMFGGLEPRLYEAGYEPHVTKYGGYVAIDGAEARRHVVGLLHVQNESLTERAVLVTTNFVPLGQRVFVYQAAEYDLRRPAGRAQGGWTYFFGTVRVSPAERLELQGTVSRGRSLDVRGLSQDVLAGRPVDARTLDGLRYQSAGGRATVEVLRGARVYGGYTRDTDNRGEAATGRWLAGAYLTDVAGSGFDVTASDTLTDRPAGRAHARYFSVGRQVGRRVYLTADYSTSLVVVRFLRGDGITVETRPETTRLGSSAVVTLGRSLSLLATADYTRDSELDDLRVTTGVSYRLR